MIHFFHFLLPAEKERQLQSNQFDLVTKYAEMEMRQKQLQQVLEHAHQEMFEYKTKQEDATSARAMEIQILNQDLDRANEVHISEREIHFECQISLACIECRTSSRKTT